MSKSLRIAFHWLSIHIISLAIPNIGEAQPMPEKLNMEYLLSQPKYRNIHHDSFCRADNDSEIGHNALPERPSVLGYQTMHIGDIRVGIRSNCVTNFTKNNKKGRVIKFIEIGRADYHITAVRANETGCDVKVAFFIKDINNFYFVCLNKKRYEVYRYQNGKQRRVAKGNKGGVRLEVNISGNNAEITVDCHKVKDIALREWSCDSNLCGMLFENKSVSRVEDFIVDYRDTFEDAGIDLEVEQGKIEKPVFGYYCAEPGVCSSSSNHVFSGKKAYRFVLKQPTQEQVKASRDRALHSTVMLDGIKSKSGNNYAGKAGGNKPLDSFILSVEFFFLQLEQRNGI